MWRPLLLALALWMLVGPLQAASAEVEICFNYGCQSRERVAFSEAELAEVGALLSRAQDAGEERALLSQAVGRLYALAGRDTPIRFDRKGNLADAGVFGKMDCIDHSTTTMHLLELLEARGLMRFHRVSPRARRTSLVLFQHFSAVIEEHEGPPPARPLQAVPDDVPVLMALCDCAGLAEDGLPAQAAEAAGTPGARFAVDSWFVEQGEPAVVLPLADWLDGDGPNVP
jgi:hypothetical protein